MTVGYFVARFERTCFRCGWRLKQGSTVWILTDANGTYLEICSRCRHGRHRKRDRKGRQ